MIFPEFTNTCIYSPSLFPYTEHTWEICGNPPVKLPFPANNHLQVAMIALQIPIGPSQIGSHQMTGRDIGGALRGYDRSSLGALAVCASPCAPPLSEEAVCPSAL